MPQALIDLWLVYGSVVRFALLASAMGLSIYVTLRTGLLSLANAGFMSLGAYTGALMTIHWHTPLLISVLGGAAVAGISGLLLGLPVLRLRDVYLAIATIGFGEVVRAIILNIDKFARTTITGGPLGLNNIPRKTETWHLFLFVVLLIYFFIRVDRSRIGRAFDAIRQDGDVAASMGIDVVRYRVLAFVLGAIIAGAAGVLGAHLSYFISPNDYGFNAAVNILTFAILGGYLTWSGPIVGAFLLTFLPEVLRFLGPYRPIVNGGILILAIIYLPRGLADPRFWRGVRSRRRGGREGRAAAPGLSEMTPRSEFDPPAPSARPRVLTPTPLLRLDRVGKHFGGLAAVDDVSFDVDQGQILGLIGPNGAGKTTLINLITGFSQASAGTITFDGADISTRPPHWIHTSGIARTFQNIRLFADMTVEENLLIGRHDRSRSGLASAVFVLPGHRREEQALRAATADLLEQMGMSAYRSLLAGELAYGDQRRVEIMRALAGEPKLLLLDEPSAGMNERETEQLGQFILSLRDRDITMIVIEHDMNLITQVCDWVQVLNFGRLIGEGAPEQIKSDPAVIEAYLGEEDDG